LKHKTRNEVQKATFGFDGELTRQKIPSPNGLKFGLGRFLMMESLNMILAGGRFKCLNAVRTAIEAKRAPSKGRRGLFDSMEN